MATLAQAGSARFVPAKFVSIDGGFSIDLPNRTDASVRPIESVSMGAGTFTWHLPEGTFTVGFVEGISVLPAEGFRVLNELAAASEAAQAKTGAKVIDRCEFSFDGFPGIELRTERLGGVRSINRFILVGQKLYVIAADWSVSGNEKSVKKILDSFELADPKSLIASRNHVPAETSPLS